MVKRSGGAPLPVPRSQVVLNPNRSVYRLDHVVAQALAGVLVGAAIAVGGPLTPWPVEVQVLGWAVVIGSVLAAFVQDRAGRRRQRLADLAEDLAPLLGPRSAGVRLKPHHWRGGWVGRPDWIRIRYDGAAPSRDPKWIREILAAAQRCLGDAPYRVRKHHEHRHLLDVELTPPESGEATSPAVSRLELYLPQLIGPSSNLKGLKFSEEDDLVGFQVAHSAGAKLVAKGYQRRVETVVGALLPGRWRAHWDTEGDLVKFEVRPTFPESVWQPTDPVDEASSILETYEDVAIPFGVDEDGHVLGWRPAIDPNMMLVGAPGTGKTVAMHGFLTAITRRGWAVWIVDGKQIEFLGFRSWPNVQVVATEVWEQVAVITRANQVMEERYRLITQGRASEADFEPLLVIIDEWADFRGNLAAWYDTVKRTGKGGDPTQPRVLELVRSLARKGRSSRVHLDIGTQRPDAKYFGDDMRDNFRARVSMGRLSPQGAIMLWENPAVGVHLPKGCRGRATAINDDNRPVEVQTYWTPDPRKATTAGELELLEKLRPAVTRHPRLLIVPPEPSTELENEDEVVEIPPRYEEYAHAKWVLATARPDLDPLANVGLAVRVDSSPMAMLGLGSTGVPPTNPGGLGPAPRRDFAGGSGDVDCEGSLGAAAGEFEGYGSAESYDVTEVQPGWLILVDETADTWAVAETAAEPDPFDEETMSLAWRGDDDESGVLALEDGQVVARAPVEEGQD